MRTRWMGLVGAMAMVFVGYPSAPAQAQSKPRWVIVPPDVPDSAKPSKRIIRVLTKTAERTLRQTGRRHVPHSQVKNRVSKEGLAIGVTPSDLWLAFAASFDAEALLIIRVREPEEGGDQFDIRVEVHELRTAAIRTETGAAVRKSIIKVGKELVANAINPPEEPEEPVVATSDSSADTTEVGAAGADAAVETGVSEATDASEGGDGERGDGSSDAVADASGSSAAMSDQPMLSVNTELKAPWTLEPPPGMPDDRVYGGGWQIFFGLTPGDAKISSGGLRTLNSTGLANFGPGTGHQASVLGYLGGSIIHFDVDPSKTFVIQASKRLTLAGARDTTGAGTQSGYNISLRMDDAYAEYLHYFSNDPQLPIFAGGWASVTDAELRFQEGIFAGAASTRSLVLPGRISVGAGVGQVYPLRWRIVVKRLEEALIIDGVIEEGLAYDLAQEIIAQWYYLRQHLMLPDTDPEMGRGQSHEQHLLRALQIIYDRGLMRRMPSMLTVYKLEQIITDQQALDRWYGWDARLGFRLAGSVVSGTDPGTGVAIPDVPRSYAVELRARSFFNLGLNADLRIDPSIGVAVRGRDALTNDLFGARRISFGNAPTRTTLASFLPNGRVVTEIPVTFTSYIYDEAYNLHSYWDLHAGLTGGYGSRQPIIPGSTPNNAAFAVNFGAAYTFFTERTVGYTFGFYGGLGYADEDFAYAFNLVASLGFGTGDNNVNNPDALGDDVPFGAASILPRAQLGGGDQ